MMTLSLKTADFSCKTNESGQSGDLRWELVTSEERISLRLRSEKETELRSVVLKFNFPFEKHDMLYLNGYQSWTDSRERGIKGRMHSLDRVPKRIVEKFSLDRYGDNRFVRYRPGRGHQHGFSYGYVRRGEEFILFGSLAEESGFTILHFDTNNDDITLTNDC